MNGDGGEDEFGDDEGDELGLGSGKKMFEVELDRAKKILLLLRFSTLLHKRVQLDILSNSAITTSSNYLASLDALPARSHALFVAFDDVIASLYARQTRLVSLLQSRP
ncbi:uncharacterized protein LAESUDRAFT_756962 [Laetiporus sulphureus 93-53]|uniref:Cyclin-D1-binding protein 1-like C-terminal domain-containing protein n=1 Tax=Laetiporus sulphureus 93-53 TaxID=1314785 RepID=A0A165FRW6_9APHY|nr:uncharacterized protein LAESUDRAFT_756962 [Laetiporus sulphureus 93-53]KZT09335.1 hypothetical protein LAESUDRAFT_756962 [Laetiporus sulphureus 93-53]